MSYNAHIFRCICNRAVEYELEPPEEEIELSTIIGPESYIITLPCDCGKVWQIHCEISQVPGESGL